MAQVRISYTPLTAGTHSVGLCADFTGWRIIDLPGEAGIYSYSFELRPGRYLYKFVVDGLWITDPANPNQEADPFGRYNSVLEVGKPRISMLKPKTQDFHVPAWVQEGIIYQIFPERFCNGDSSINPDFSEDWYRGSTRPPNPGEFLPKNQEYYHLVEDWYDWSGLKQSPYLPQGKPDWWSFYGGDLAGVMQKLDYLVDLGITIIYFNPLWQAKSNHKYDAADYMSIDPHFGNPELMKELVRKAHAKGIRIILDVAFNHTGETFWAFRDCVTSGPESEWWDWYDWKQWPLPDPLPADFNPKDYYQCWWGIKDMPDLNYDLSRPHPQENDIKDITQAEPNQSLIKHLEDVCRWWLQEMDIDGFRLDVPDEVPWWFWKLFRSWVKRYKADAWLVGELWNNAQAWVQPEYFDSVMNYAYFKAPVHDYFLRDAIDKQEFIRRISEAQLAYPTEPLKAMMNLMDSHDTWRVWELEDEKKHRALLAYLFQMTYLGVPHIYYGDEIGMRGEGDPDNRRPFNWHWESDPEAVRIREEIKAMIKLRKSYACLVHGDLKFVESAGPLLVYRRQDKDNLLEIVINISDTCASWFFDKEPEVIHSLGELTRISKRQILLCPNSGGVFSY